MTSEPRALLTVGAVAQRLKVAVPTLRSWERRYGLGPSERSEGGHRRYTDDDVARLRRMLALTGQGVPPHSAARVVLGQDDAPARARHGGGSGSLAVGDAGPVVRGLSRDAARLDVDAVRRGVEALLRQHGVVNTWVEVACPLLQRIGEAYERTPERVIPVEHAASAGIAAALHGIAPVPAEGRMPALLGCAPDEQHTLALEALRAALAERGRASHFLGARLPAPALESAAARLRPLNTVVWAHHARLARKVPLDHLIRHSGRVLLAGPGWARVRVPRTALLAPSLPEAVDAVLDPAPGTP